MIKKIKKLTPLWIIIIGLLILRSMYYPNINNIPTGEYIKSVTSPNKRYKLNVYRYSGGPTLDWSSRIEVEYVSTGKRKNIYWNYHDYNPSIRWIDNDNIRINNKKLNIHNDTFDFRVDDMDA